MQLIFIAVKDREVFLIGSLSSDNMHSLEMAIVIRVVAVILLICPRLKSSTAHKHTSSNSGLHCSSLSSIFLVTDCEEAVLEDWPTNPGPESQNNDPDSLAA